MAYLRRQGIHVHPYNWLIRGRIQWRTATNLECAPFLFMGLSLPVTYEKSSVTPSRRIEFIKAVFHSRSEKACPPEDRFQLLEALLLHLVSKWATKIWTCLAVLGHVSACWYLALLARIHLCSFQLWLRSV